MALASLTEASNPFRSSTYHNLSSTGTLLFYSTFGAVFGFETMVLGTELQAFVCFLRHLTEHYRHTDYTSASQSCTRTKQS